MTNRAVSILAVRVHYDPERSWKILTKQSQMSGFEVHVVQKIIQNVLEKYLEHQEYDGPLMGQKSRTLADMIKEKVKALHYDRYKIVTWVVIGQKGCNDIRIASKGVWDKDNDNYAEAVYENKSLYALGVCYAIYQE